MMISRFFTVIFLLSLGFVNAQVLYEFPKGQDFYEGGRDALYRDLITEAVKSEMKSCEKTEALFMRFVVYPDKSIKYVSDEDTDAVNNNSCLKAKVLQLITKLNKWKPAEENSEKVAAMFSMIFTDDMLINNHSLKNEFTMPIYVHKGKESSIGQFRENFSNCFDTTGFKPTGSYSFKLNFDIDTKGEPSFFHIDNMSTLESFNKMVVKCASNTKKSYWKPGTYRGVPIKQVMKLPIVFSEN